MEPLATESGGVRTDDLFSYDIQVQIVAALGFFD